jgi:hypothetical protein
MQIIFWNFSDPTVEAMHSEFRGVFGEINIFKNILDMFTFPKN